MISDGLAVRLHQGPGSVPSVRAAALQFVSSLSPVTGLMPETQAVNVLSNAVWSESGPLPRLQPPVLSLSSIVIRAFHHGARRAFFMLFLAFQLTSCLTVERMMKEGNTKTHHGFDTHWRFNHDFVSVYRFSFTYFPYFVCHRSIIILFAFLGILLYMFYRSLSCQIKCKPKGREVLVVITPALPGSRVNLKEQQHAGGLVSPDILLISSGNE